MIMKSRNMQWVWMKGEKYTIFAGRRAKKKQHRRTKHRWWEDGVRLKFILNKQGRRVQTGLFWVSDKLLSIRS